VLPHQIMDTRNISNPNIHSVYLMSTSIRMRSIPRPHIRDLVFGGKARDGAPSIIGVVRMVGIAIAIAIAIAMVVGLGADMPMALSKARGMAAAVVGTGDEQEILGC
jgi:hypothetical protein